jgi:hypothetical protein
MPESTLLATLCQDESCAPASMTWPLSPPWTRPRGLSRRLKNQVLLKREDLQPVFSFKLRGAYNKMAQLTKDEQQRGVICASAGNHAQGVALSTKQAGGSRHHRDAADHAGHQGQCGKKSRRSCCAARRCL